MSSDQTAALNALHANLNELFEKFDEANGTAPPGVVDAIRVELRETADDIARIEAAANSAAAANLDAIADALEDRVEAQMALGFDALVEKLKTVLTRIRPSSPALGNEAPAAAVTVNATIDDTMKSIVQSIIAAATAAEFPVQTALCIAAIESDFRLNARNPHSSAGGLFQFIDSTWTALGGSDAEGGGRGNGHASFADAETQAAIGLKHLSKLRKGLQPSFDPVTATKIYMAHQQGPSGAKKILSAAPDAAIETVISEKAARNNRLDGLTVRETIQRFHDMVSVHMEEIRPLIQTEKPQAGTTPAPVLPGKRPAAHRAPSIALKEMRTFARKDEKVVTEDQEPLRSRGLQYFSLVGSERSSISGAANAWSAAFISFVLRQAGLEQTVFPFAANHASYILRALANTNAIRESGQGTPAQKALTYREISEAKPRVGDLVGYGSTTRTSQLLGRPVKSTADISLHLPNTHFPSHTDLVVDVQPGKIKVIGGNVDNTIKLKTFDLDDDGKLKSGQEPFFILCIDQ